MATTTRCVATVSVQVSELCRYPGRGWKEGRSALFVRALCGDETTGEVSCADTPRSATWRVDPPGSPLCRVVWAETPWLQLNVTELASDLVLQLRSVADGVTGTSEGSVRGELCLPLAALVGALSRDTVHTDWFELLPPRARGTSWHTLPVLPPAEGAPGFLRLAVKCALNERLSAAYSLTPFTPPLDRNPTGREPRHPELCVTDPGSWMRSWERAHCMVITVSAGVFLSPLRTVCYLQTWREPSLNFALLAVTLGATRPAIWHYVFTLWPLYLWIWSVLNGRVMLALRATEPRRTWGVASRGAALSTRVLGAALGVPKTIITAPITAVSFLAKAAPEMIHTLHSLQIILIVIGERLEQLDNALSWEDPCATRLLLGALLAAACTTTAALALLQWVSFRIIAATTALAAVVPAPAITYHLLLTALEFLVATNCGPVSLKPHFLSGLPELPELTNPICMTWLDSALQRLRNRYSQVCGLVPDNAASAMTKVPIPSTAPPLHARLMHLLSRLPSGARIAHMRAHLGSAVGASSSAEYHVHARLIVSYNPLVQLHGALSLELELHIEDTALLSKPSPSEAASGRIALEFRLELTAGDSPLFSLEVLPPVAARHKWLDRSTCTPAAGWTMPAPVVACKQAQPLWRTALLLHPAWEVLDGPGAGTSAHVLPHDGLRTALMFRMKLGRGRSVSLGPVPVLVAPPGAAMPTSLPSWLAHSKLEYDVMLSYRDIETGTSGDRFALELAAALRSLHNLRVFMYADACAAGDEALCPVPHGVSASMLFVPICSPGYANPHSSPCSGNELLAAVRRAVASGKAAAPLILPVWHSGVFPPAGAAPVLAALPFEARHLRVPRQVCEGTSEMALLTVMEQADPVGKTAAALARAVHLARKGMIRQLAAEFGDVLPPRADAEK